ncbi:MAG TPA: hydantoinase/oxoprolinase family protein [Acidimicrobiia bacterium]|nr:hydantoinase/oxoprolinase family protein [Acidimicrobiia bacterium]
MRVGVDVGGTFTKAVALDGDARVVARAVVPTTHSHPDGVAAGVIHVVGEVAAELAASGAGGADAIELVTHSTTQAVNALLEGDVVPVGIVGMATAPHVAKARKRTALARIDLTDSRALRTVHEFLDTTGGFDAGSAREAVGRLRSAGVGALCVAEAFAPDDTSNEAAVAALAAEAGIPATTSTELSGLYGLELRTLTGTLNASILPIALRTAEVVQAGVASVGVAAPVMVMRGDGGATDLAGFRRAPALTLYSGPAASVAGALRTGAIGDAVIVEVGGTSSNVAAIKGGRPVLAYVQVGKHSTAVRALDVRVAGVAGGSMLRVRKRTARGFGGAPRGVYGVGPRSAHIAGLPYACFGSAADYAGAEAVTIAPKAGDPDDYLVLRLADGRHVALTNTCAANALGMVADGDYAAGDRAAALTAFEAAGRFLHLPAEEVARRMITATTDLLGDLVTAVAKQHQLVQPKLVAVGGGAGGVGRALARALGYQVIVPPAAEVISSVGDALSLVRVERERTFASNEAADVASLVADVEAEAVAAGAAPASLDVQVQQMPSKGAVRVVATGAVALASGLVPGRAPVGPGEAARAAAERGFPAPEPVGSYWFSRLADGGRALLLDRFGDVVLDVKGEAAPVPSDAAEGSAMVQRLVAGQVRHMGPVTIAPTVWLVTGHRLRELSEAEQADLSRQLPAGDDGAAMIIVGRT